MSISKIDIDEWKRNKEKELEDIEFNKKQEEIEFRKRRIEQEKYDKEFKPIFRHGLFLTRHFYNCPICGERLKETKIKQGTIQGQSMHGTISEVKHNRFLLDCNCGYKYAQNRYPFNVLMTDD
ncbi:MAG: hypothetical protein WC623_22575 [Pedobacter sp.]|uniref:hypothetical protein n=1 Tax=Pedobacter sp. TaxID=1411316 RepID=UPI00356452C6